ncbi:hypothetical protein BDP27DRAFT_1252590 [Rhodocollybia butyracea]|uniref:DUF202 domain-containing protein n=1 Tax=Rhodocollybia butyracea TaxID=206335 RepID=A0A9P5QC40_9AGAR|nr:hypothetical protein BDP27DRAFT_1252590 [Rhodocollybia butyracea]
MGFNAPPLTDTNIETSSPSLRRTVSFKPAEQHLRPSPEKSARRFSQSSALLAPSSTPDSSNIESPVEDVAEGNGEHDSQQKSFRPRRILARYNPMLILENRGSVARDHLASERTFLAYVRTSLAIASTGVALVQLFTVSSSSGSKASALASKYARPLGSVSICLGIVVLLVGILRYFTVQHALIQGSFPVARLTIGSVSVILLAIIVAVFAALVAGHR